MSFTRAFPRDEFNGQPEIGYDSSPIVCDQDILAFKISVSNGWFASPRVSAVAKKNEHVKCRHTVASQLDSNCH